MLMASTPSVYPPVVPRRFASSFEHLRRLRVLGWHIENDSGQNKAKTTQWTITAPKGRPRVSGGPGGSRQIA
jgi:hypothetical protein